MNKANGVEFGKRLEQLMKDAKVTNTEITRQLNLNKNAIGNYKNGQIPNAAIIIDISNFLGISIDYLLTGKEPEELTPEERNLVNLYRLADERGKRAIIRTAEAENLEQESSDSKIG